MTAAQIATKAHARPIRRLRRLGREGVPELDWFALLEAKTRLTPSAALRAANGLPWCSTLNRTNWREEDSFSQFCSGLGIVAAWCP